MLLEDIGCVLERTIPLLNTRSEIIVELLVIHTSPGESKPLVEISEERRPPAEHGVDTHLQFPARQLRRLGVASQDANARIDRPTRPTRPHARQDAARGLVEPPPEQFRVPFSSRCKGQRRAECAISRLQGRTLRMTHDKVEPNIAVPGDFLNLRPSKRLHRPASS